MNNCPECGRERHTGRFCSNCGYDMIQELVARIDRLQTRFNDLERHHDYLATKLDELLRIVKNEKH